MRGAGSVVDMLEGPIYHDMVNGCQCKGVLAPAAWCSYRSLFFNGDLSIRMFPMVSLAKIDNNGQIIEILADVWNTLFFVIMVSLKVIWWLKHSTSFNATNNVGNISYHWYSLNIIPQNYLLQIAYIITFIKMLEFIYKYQFRFLETWDTCYCNC